VQVLPIELIEFQRTIVISIDVVAGQDVVGGAAQEDPIGGIQME